MSSNLNTRRRAVSSSKEPVSVVPDEFDIEGNEAADDSELISNKLFAGDCGELDLHTRRTLMQLLSGPFISNRKNSKLWASLRKNEKIIRSRLSELFLDLIIDEDQQIAFIKQAEVDNIEVPTLLRKSQLTFLESALILHLRRQLSQADIAGERAVISLAEIFDHLSVYERGTSTDRAGFVKKVNSAIVKLKGNNILQLIRGTQDRYEISPTLKILFSATEITALIDVYKQLLDGGDKGEIQVNAPTLNDFNQNPGDINELQLDE